MDELFAKLSSYNLFNTLLPGAVFCLVASYLQLFSLDTSNIITLLITYYVVGLVISRVGSVVIEPVLLRLDWLRHAPYDAYVRASKADGKIEVLVETNNTYRALLSTAVCLLGALTIASARRLFPENTILDLAGVTAAVAALFFFAYRKQTSYIRRRVEIGEAAIKTAGQPDIPPRA